MWTDTADPETVAAAEAQSDLDARHAEFRLRVLERLTEVGMGLVEALGERGLAAEGGSLDLDAAEAFCRLSRSIRLTVTLHAKAQETLSAAKGAAAKARET